MNLGQIQGTPVAFNKYATLDAELVTRLAGPKARFIDYPILERVDNLDQLFDRKHQSVVLFYRHQINDRDVEGHYSAILKHPNTFEFFDSYGMKPDDIIIRKSVQDRTNTGQPFNSLSRLFYNASKPIEYNEIRFQSLDPKISTCGFYTAIRCRFGDVPLKDFQNILKNTCQQFGIKPDDFIVDLTKTYLNK